MIQILLPVTRTWKKARIIFTLRHNSWESAVHCCIALPGVHLSYDIIIWCSLAEDTDVESVEEECKPPPSKKCENLLNTGVSQS